MSVLNNIISFAASVCLLLSCVQQTYRMVNYPSEYPYYYGVEILLVFISSMLLLLEVFVPRCKPVKYKLWLVPLLCSILI